MANLTPIEQAKQDLRVAMEGMDLVGAKEAVDRIDALSNKRVPLVVNPEENEDGFIVDAFYPENDYLFIASSKTGGMGLCVEETPAGEVLIRVMLFELKDINKVRIEFHD